MKTHRKVSAIAKHLRIQESEVNIIDIDFDIFEAGGNEYYASSKKEAIAREYDTFVECYYNEMVRDFRKFALASVNLPGYSMHRRVDLNNVEKNASKCDIRFVDNMLKGMIVEPKQAFKNLKFFDESVQGGYCIVDNVYILAR